jgi:hypothetical protein
MNHQQSAAAVFAPIRGNEVARFGSETRPGHVHIPCEVVVFTKLSDADHSYIAGCPLDFALLPDAQWSDTELAIARPNEVAMRTGGQSVVSPEAQKRDGAWLIRHVDGQTFLINLQVVRGFVGAVFEPNKRPEDRSVFVEQFTFKFDRNHWAAYAPLLFRQACTWINSHGQWHVPKHALIPPKFWVDKKAFKRSAEMFDYGPLTGTSQASVQFARTDLSNSDRPLEALLNELEPSERATVSLADGFSQRVAGASIQLIEPNHISLLQAMRIAGVAEHASDTDIFAVQFELATNEKDDPSRNISQLVDRVLQSYPQFNLISEDFYADIRNLMQASPDDLYYVKKHTLRASVVLFDICYGLCFENRNLARPVLEIFQNILLGWTRQKVFLQHDDLTMISWLEFAPAVLGEFPQMQDTDDGDLVLANVRLLRELDRDAFGRMTLRMELPSDGLYESWEGAVLSSYSNFAFRACVKRHDAFFTNVAPKRAAAR